MLNQVTSPPTLDQAYAKPLQCSATHNDNVPDSHHAIFCMQVNWAARTYKVKAYALMITVLCMEAPGGKVRTRDRVH